MAKTITVEDDVDLFDLFKSNKNNEESGVWMDLTPSVGFKVRAYGSQVVIDKRDELMKPYQVMLRSGAKLPEDKNEEIGLRVIAGAIIADWKGVKNADKEPVKYSAEEAYQILKALPKLASTIIQWSLDGQLYQDEVTEDNVKNS